LARWNFREVFVASPLSTQHYGERAKIGWLGIRIMCPNGVTFLNIFMIFTYLKLSMFLSSTGQNGQVKYYHLVSVVFKQVYSSTCSTKELSITMTKIVHAVKGGLLSYCGNNNHSLHSWFTKPYFLWFLNIFMMFTYLKLIR
jgi:hypothetical protein